KSHTVPVMKYAGRGKPKAGEEKVTAGYKIESTFSREIKVIEKPEQIRITCTFWCNQYRRIM
ncbi:MAG: hypothetical protein KBD90_03485, partial [Alphaproteobacteria bacterium]|nr:hypothetical protein [Alphaproteobacteria bacterium]